MLIFENKKCISEIYLVHMLRSERRGALRRLMEQILILR